MLAEHEISLGTGRLIQRSSDRRNREIGVPELIAQVVHIFSNSRAATKFAQQLHEKYPRYTRDQLQAILRLQGKYSKSELDHALQFCLDNHLISVTDFKATLEMLPGYEAHLNQMQAEMAEIPISEATQTKLAVIRPEVRSLDTYTKILKGVPHGAN